MKTSLVSVKTFTRNLLGRLAAVLLAIAAPTAQAHWPNTNATKFVQLPDNTINGIDVDASSPFWVADDFVCTNTGPIVDLHLWCSWRSDQLDPSTTFTLSIWSDVPGMPFSHPGTMLWISSFYPGQYEMVPAFNANERFLVPGQGFNGLDMQCYQCNFYPTSPFTQTGSITAPIVYWLVVNAAPQSSAAFGWKTSTNHFNNYSVFGSTGPGNWQQIFVPPPTPGYLDLAFALTTTNKQCPAPTISCTNRAVQCGAWAPIPPWAWDNCGNSNLICTLVSSQTNGACPWTVTLVWKATDYLGRTNLCNQIVTVTDTTPPVMTCVTNKTVQCNAAWSFDTPPASDACCGTNVTVTILSTVTNGACPWNITRTWKAVDCCTNSATCSQTVTVVDAVPPVVVCPGLLSYSADTNCHLTLPDLRALLNVTDCSSVTITQTPAPGTVLGLGTTNVTFAVVDACGNSNGCVATVQVNDTLPPVVTWPPTTLRLVTDTNCNAVLLPDLLANVQASDCSPPVTLAQTPAAGTALNIGTHPVTLTAVDQVHNTNSCTVAVVVVPPVPLITQQPSSVIARLGDRATFTVSAQSCTNFSYQWTYNGANIANATNSYYTVPAAGPGNLGNYAAAVFNAGGTAYTVRASLRLGDPTPHLIRNYTPAAWQASDVYWGRDISPHNKIDDLIDASSDSFFDVFVNFNRCVQPEDMLMLAQIGNSNRVVMQSKYLSSVAMAGLTKEEITNLALQPGIAFIEQQLQFTHTLAVSVPSLCVIAGSASCNGNVQDTWGYNGTGVGIVIMDSGVDNKVCKTFANNTNINGYDAVIAVANENQRYTDPPDECGHGTSVASIALGQGSSRVPRGVATNATLIDVRVLDGSCSCWETNVIKALEVVYDNRVNWGVDIINMSFYAATNMSDGTDALSQLVDLGESMGITVVVAAGNNGPNNVGLRPPACASRAITVGATDDQGTTSRADDTMANFSARGPRTTPPAMNDLKPEVVAPGMMTTTPYCWDKYGNIVYGIKCAAAWTNDDWACWEGTSQAAPHVSGVAALIKQALPTINPASIKQMLIQTAEQTEDCKNDPSYPNLDAKWNKASGWGEVNAYAALSAAATDMAFPSYPVKPYWWMSPDISVNPYPTSGKTSTITATIKNNGPNDASNVRVQFGVHDFSAAIETFYEIGTVVTDVANGVQKNVQLDWTPVSSGHQCLEAEIGYGPDTDYANNKAQHNFEVAQSPVYFQVRNTLTEGPVTIQFVPEFENPTQGWNVQISPTTVSLNGSQCPATVEVLMIPPSGAQPGLTNRVHISATIVGSTNVLGGVTVEASTKIIISPIQRNSDGSFTFSWTTSGRPGEGTLQWATDVTGPWTQVPGSPTSPYTFTANELQKFFRVHYP